MRIAVERLFEGFMIIFQEYLARCSKAKGTGLGAEVSLSMRKAQGASSCGDFYVVAHGRCAVEGIWLQHRALDAYSA